MNGPGNGGRRGAAPDPATGVEAGEASFIVTWLEMRRRPAMRRPTAPLGPPAMLLRAVDPPGWYFRTLYDAVGDAHLWTDMHALSREETNAWMAQPGRSLYTLLQRNWPQGFFVLERQDGGICDINYLGLVPEAVGQGLGRFLLDSAVQAGWDHEGVTGMSVNTCSLDHPRALRLYQQAGFVPVRREERRLTDGATLATLPPGGALPGTGPAPAP